MAAMPIPLVFGDSIYQRFSVNMPDDKYKQYLNKGSN